MSDQEKIKTPEVESPNVVTPAESNQPIALADTVVSIQAAETAPVGDVSDAIPDQPPAVEPEPGIPAITLDPTNTLGGSPSVSDASIPSVSKSEKLDLIESLESGMRHFIREIEQLFGTHHPEVNILKSVVNNDLQSLKKKA